MENQSSFHAFFKGFAEQVVDYFKIKKMSYLALSSMLTRSESPSDSEMKLPFQRSMDFFCANIKLTLCLDELSIIDYTY